MKTGLPTVASSDFLRCSSCCKSFRPSSQLASDGSVALEGVKIVVVCLASAALLWRIWGILKNTGAWRYLLLLLGVDPAAQPDEEAAAHGRLLIDGDPTAGQHSFAPNLSICMHETTRVRVRTLCMSANLSFPRT